MGMRRMGKTRRRLEEFLSGKRRDDFEGGRGGGEEKEKNVCKLRLGRPRLG